MSSIGEKSNGMSSKEFNRRSKRIKGVDDKLDEIQDKIGLHDAILTQMQMEVDENFTPAMLEVVDAEVKEVEEASRQIAQRSHELSATFQRVENDSAIFNAEHGQVTTESVSLTEDAKAVSEEIQDYQLKLKALKKDRKMAFNQRQKNNFSFFEKFKANVMMKSSECNKLDAEAKGLASELAALDKVLMELVEGETDLTSANAEVVNKIGQLDRQTELEWGIIKHRMYENQQYEGQMQQAQEYIISDGYATDLVEWDTNAVMYWLCNVVSVTVEQDELNSIWAAVDENIQLWNATGMQHGELLRAYACHIGNMENQEQRLNIARERLADKEAIGVKQQEELVQLLSNIELRKRNVKDIDVALEAVRRECSEAENVVQSVSEEIRVMEAKEKTLADESKEIVVSKAKIQAKLESVAVERREIAAELADMDMEGLEKQLTETRERIQDFQRQSQLKKSATAKELADLRNEKRDGLAMLAALEARAATGAEEYRSKMSLLGDLTKQVEVLDTEMDGMFDEQQAMDRMAEMEKTLEDFTEKKKDQLYQLLEKVKDLTELRRERIEKRRKLDEHEKEIEKTSEEVDKIRGENARLVQKLEKVRADREMTYGKVKAAMKGKGKAKENVGGLKKPTGMPQRKVKK